MGRIEENRGQFHKHFTSSFYANSQVKQLFVLQGSARVKAVRKNIDEIDPWRRRRGTFRGELSNAKEVVVVGGVMREKLKVFLKSVK